MAYEIDSLEVRRNPLAYHEAKATVSNVSSTAVRTINPKEYDDAKADHVDAAFRYGLIVDPVNSLPWTKQKKAADFFTGLLTCLYALILTIIALIIEVSPTWKNDIWMAEIIFFVFMYGCGIVFFLCCYIFLIHPESYNFIVKWLVRMKILQSSNKWIIEKTNHDSEGAGTLYLRLGALFFGSAGIVLFGLEMFLCIENMNCKASSIAKHIMAMVFTFIQMHFIFCNSKISIGVYKLAKFGMMHLVSVNLWTWFRFVLAKTEHKVARKQAYAPLSSASPSEEVDRVKSRGDLVRTIVNGTYELVVETVRLPECAPSAAFKHCLGAIDQFGDAATFLTTCLVEYSLIGAAVMFIQWKSTGCASRSNHGDEKVKRKYKMRIDCSSSSTGLFVGIIFLIAAFVSMGVFTIFEELRNSRGAQMVFGIVDLCMFCMTLGACLLGLWRMKVLQYRICAHGEVIDEILLIIGLVGEIVYCVIGMDTFLATRRAKIDHSLLPAFVFACRLIQVVVQAAFILITSRLRCLSPYAIKNKPGKQIITFLLVANATLFVFHTYEGMKSSFGFNEYGGTTYTNTIYAVAPLLVFYRFHSSACLAEIWKHTYSTKPGDSRLGSITSSESNLTLDTTVVDNCSSCR